MPFAANRAPVEPGYFVLRPDGAPRLVGSYSPGADTCFFPRRRICPVTLGPVVDRELSTRGTLYSWTYLYEDRYGAITRGRGGYGIGQIDLPEGPRIQSRLLGAFGDWHIGMAMELALLDVMDGEQPARNTDGQYLVTFCFRAVAR